MPKQFLAAMLLSGAIGIGTARADVVIYSNYSSDPTSALYPYPGGSTANVNGYQVS